MTRYKINIYSIISCALFLAVFKQYFLPDAVRQMLKILILVGTFLFLIYSCKKKMLLNVSLMFCASVILSSIVATIRGNYGFRNLLDSLLYALTFYDLYTFSALCKQKGYSDRLIDCMYNMNLIYCILTIISVAMVGIDNNSNNAAYFFGNKFTSSYLFILLISLYGASHDMSNKKNKITLFTIFCFSILFSLYVECATATITLAALFVIYLMPEKIKRLVVKERYVVIALILSAVVIIWIEAILKIDFINRLVTDFFHKSYTLTGRLEIYGSYLAGVIKGSLWTGYGYSNSVMMDLTGVYANAQNGLLEIFVSFGILGVIVLVFTVYYCFKHGEKGNSIFYLSLVVYGMIIAAIFEISLNWFFLLGLCLIRWSSNNNDLKYRRKIKIKI